ncbi:MAG: hypothetical protein GEV04_20640 [Actinophytocola sp.]|nr:hypothetical protein [Actinophytocola sp.]
MWPGAPVCRRAAARAAPSRRVANSATSPLNVLLLGGLSAVFGDPVVAAGVLYVGTCVAVVGGLLGLGRATGLGYRVAVLGGPLLIASPLLVSTVGLETMLVVAALPYLVWACVRGDAVMAGLTAGVLLWLRLDMVVFATVLVLATPALWRRLYVVAALAVAVVAPWLVFSWFTLGSAVPDTLVIKSGTSRGAGLIGLIGRYGEPYTWAVGGIFVVSGVGLLSAATWAWWHRHISADTPVGPALVAAGAAYFGVIWSLDVPSFFWYYAPTLVALALAATLGLAALSAVATARVARAAAVTVGAGLLVTTAIPWWHGVTTKTPLREMPMHGNFALPGQYEKIGRELGAIVGDAPVRSAGEVGALVYFCDCTITDRFSDRARVAERIEDARDDSWLYELNYLLLDTRALDPIKPRYRLDWQPGPDTSSRGWDTTGIFRGRGHYELLTKRSR